MAASTDIMAPLFVHLKNLSDSGQSSSPAWTGIDWNGSPQIQIQRTQMKQICGSMNHAMKAALPGGL